MNYNDQTQNGYQHGYPAYTYEGYGGAIRSGGQSLPAQANGAYRDSEPIEPVKQSDSPGKKPKKAVQVIAAVLACALVSGGAGGGAAWYVVKNYQPAQPGSIAAGATTESAVTQPAVVTGTETDVSQVVRRASGSVVEIVTRLAGNPFRFQGTTSGAGSGVVFSEDGYIITNNHVVEGAQNITIRTEDGTEYAAALIGTDEKTDLAVLKVEATGLQAANFADSDAIIVGQVAVVIGNPLGELGGTVTSGIISATGREITIDNETMTLLQTSAAVNPGNSGGGLFDQNGNLVGIVNAKSSGIDIEGIGFAIPSNTVKEVVNEIIDNGYVTGRPQFGISVIEVNDPYSLAMYRLQTPGVYIASDENPSGLQAGDRIVRVEGEEIEASSQIGAILAKHQVGDVLTVTVEREGQELSVDVTLTEQVPEGARTVQDEV